MTYYVDKTDSLTRLQAEQAKSYFKGLKLSHNNHEFIRLPKFYPPFEKLSLTDQIAESKTTREEIQYAQ